MFKFFLDFRHDNIGLVEIAEPIGFDASTFTIEQGKFARDITFGSEEVDLEFIEHFGEPTTPRQLPNGKVINHLTMGLDYLLYIFNTYGFEAEVYFILQRNGQTFNVGQILFSGATTDNLQYFRCKIVQQLERAEYKRNAKVKTDVFANKNLKGEEIALTPFSKLLVKAKPLNGISEWQNSSSQNFVVGGNGGIFQRFLNNSATLGKSDLRASLSFINGLGNVQDFKIIRAEDDLKSVSLKLDLQCNAFVNTAFGNAICSFYVIVAEEIDNNTWVQPVGTNILQKTLFTNITFTPDILSRNINLQQTIPLVDIPRGFSVYIFASVFVNTNNTPFFFTINFQKADYTINATSIAINSVINAVRLIDLLKSKVRAIGNLPLMAPDLEPNGEHYNNFAFNGKMVRQLNNDFNNTMLECFEPVCEELNFDYQINNENIKLLPYKDFYPNTEIAVFPTSPNNNYSEEFNDRYLLNVVNFKYEKYEQDRDERGTIDAIHTESQWKFANKMADNELNIKVDYIRDPFLLESTRRKNIASNSDTSVSQDDDIFVLDCLPLAPGTQQSFSYRVLYQTNGNLLKISNRISNDDDVYFRWDLIGLAVGGTFIIEAGKNIGTYTVTEITPNVLTVQGVPANINYNGQSLSRFRYTLSGVDFVMRTNEGFSEILGVSGDFANLRYSQKRNLKRYEEFLAAVNFYSQKQITNQFYKVNSNLSTMLGDERDPFVEVAPLPTENAIIKPIIAKVQVVSNFEDILNICNVQDGGFIRCLDQNNNVIRGYFKKLSHTWATGLTDLELEIKNDSQIIEINDLDWFSYQINNDWVQLFDEQSRPLINPTNYKFLSVNGTTYDNLLNFVESLENE